MSDAARTLAVILSRDGLRAACIHGRYESHSTDYWDEPLGKRIYPGSCPGGRKVTDAEIRELAHQIWLKDQTRLIDKVLSDEALAPSAAIGDTG